MTFKPETYSTSGCSVLGRLINPAQNGREMVYASANLQSAGVGSLCLS